MASSPQPSAGMRSDYPPTGTSDKPKSGRTVPYVGPQPRQDRARQHENGFPTVAALPHDLRYAGSFCLTGSRSVVYWRMLRCRGGRRGRFGPPRQGPIREAVSEGGVDVRCKVTLVVCAWVVCATACALAETVSVGLGFVPPTPEANTLDLTFTVTVMGNSSGDSDSATLTGMALVDLVFEADPVSQEITTTGLEFTGGTLSVSNLSFLVDMGLLGAIEAAGNGLSGTFDTPLPPGPVSGTTFPADRHEMIFNNGTFYVTGSGFVGGLFESVSVDLAVEPMTAVGDGMGSLSVSSPTLIGDVATYDVLLLLPLSIDELVYDDGTIQVDAVGGCVLTATGQFARLVDTSIPGDLNEDGFVGQADLDIVLGAWGTRPPSDPRADPDGNGLVAQGDLDTVLSNWAAGTPPAAVPEPATLGMFAFCAPALLRRRSKSR